MGQRVCKRRDQIDTTNSTGGMRTTLCVSREVFLMRMGSTFVTREGGIERSPEISL